jgi:TolB-like protein/Tfp pilus assembly protein PilF
VNTPPRTEPSPDEVRAQAARILASRHFAKSPRLSRFLEFTLEKALGGDADTLKEYLIGVEVFGRPASFDPRADGIVRVQAVNLRARLAAYYAKDGDGDPVIIECVKGSYGPSWRARGGEQPSKPSEPDSIAVLPFVNMSPDPENEYFSDGLTEELISALSNLRGVRVVARTSVFQYKGKAADIREIGSKLNAGMVLEGSVRKSADRLAITAQLVDASNGYERWSRTYQVEMKDLFAVQQEIAGAIAATFSAQQRGAALAEPDNLEAYHAYLRGRFHLNKWTEEGFRKGVGFFEDAIRLDPSMARAHAGLADALFVLACYGKSAPGELMPKARAAAETALRLNEHLAEAHVSRAAVLATYDWDWERSESEFRRAIQLEPNHAAAHQWYGILCLLPRGRLDEARRAIGEALRHDPLSAPIHTSLGLVFFAQNRFDEAIVCFEKALEFDPDFQLAHWWLGAIYLSRHQLIKAFGELRKAGAVPSDRLYDAARFTYGDGLTGRGRKAASLLEQLKSETANRYVSPAMIAAVQVVLGKTDSAFAWLEKAVEVRDAWLVWLGVDRRFDHLRKDPRFQALARRIGIGQIARRKLTVK